MLRHLKHSGCKTEELVTVYKTVMRPSLDVCTPVYYSMLTDEQDQLVERLQAQAMENIFGYKMSYANMRKLADVTTHHDRRIDLADKFAKKEFSNTRFFSIGFRPGKELNLLPKQTD